MINQSQSLIKKQLPHLQLRLLVPHEPKSSHQKTQRHHVTAAQALASQNRGQKFRQKRPKTPTVTIISHNRPQKSPHEACDQHPDHVHVLDRSQDHQHEAQATRT